MVFVLADDREMIRLNRCYLGKNRTTDVLAFDLSDAPGVVDGEVYIGLEQARRQARDHRVPLYVEVARLAIHGVLHLAGYDDHRDHDRQLMHRLEEQSLKAMRPRR
jgi:probable rRNA maturation factor